MEGISSTITGLWNFINVPFTYGSVSFTLFDVIKTGLILSIIGTFIGKVILFHNNRR